MSESNERKQLRHYHELLKVHLGLDPAQVENLKPADRAAAFREAISRKGGKRTAADMLAGSGQVATLGGREIKVRPLPFREALEWKKAMVAKMNDLKEAKSRIDSITDPIASAAAGFEMATRQDEITAELVELWLGEIPAAATMDEINAAWEVVAGLAYPFMRTAAGMQATTRTPPSGS